MRIIHWLQERRIVRSFHLHRSERGDWTDAVFWLVLILFSALMPVWLPFLFLALFSQSPSLQTFTANGEFALISASLVSAALYVVTKESKWNFLRQLLPQHRIGTGTAFPNQRLFIVLTGILTLVSSVIYLGASFATIPGVSSVLTLNTRLVHVLSLILFASTLLLSFSVTVIENAFTNRPDIRSWIGEEYVDFERRFAELEEDNQ